jgi:L-serine dehydratase
MPEAKFVSILNDVLGPVMRGPSSSHTAGSYHIGRIVRSLLGDEPAAATFTFDRDGSYARTYRAQAVDLGFAAGLMGWAITDRRFLRALDIARKSGLRLSFKTGRLPGAAHPNTVRIAASSREGGRLAATAESTGGGGFVFTEVDGLPSDIRGKSHETIVIAAAGAARGISGLMTRAGRDVERPFRSSADGASLAAWRKDVPLDPGIRSRIEAVPGIRAVRTADPVFFLRRGDPLFRDAEGMVRYSAKTRRSLGETALVSESRLLGIPENDILVEILRRYAVMKASVDQGLRGSGLGMRLLKPSAGLILEAASSGRTAVGGAHAAAAARAMAVMHVANSRGIICAAPTGGAAGALPGVVVTLAEKTKAGDREIALMLLAAGAVGLIVAERATFAAEVAGCQVEIGAAGAMAAAAVVESVGGSARQAADAAAISLQNTMGSTCDPVQGMCEIPCHTRNAAAAAGAFVCADLVLGGYRNPIPLDETIDAAFETGKMLPPELRCTARGGLALAPSVRPRRGMPGSK